MKPTATPRRCETVITTHINADFDAVGSMLAAQKLYPEAVVVFPGAQERNLRNFFIQSLVYLFNMADFKAIDLSSVRRLVLVDTRQASRIGPLAALLERSDVDIHIYDHHPTGPNDIQSHFEISRVTGATVTILVEQLQAKGIAISPEEATAMALGIYEDTGSFTFHSTTADDFHAAAWLLSQGANLHDVAALISREISPEQVGLLNEMIEAASTVTIAGVDITLTHVTTNAYVTDFALLVHKMTKIEQIDALFAMARMGEKIYLVARSRLADVDAGAIMSLMGGGGHPFAASATIKGMTLAQTEQRIIEILYSEVQPRRQAKNLMSAPAITIAADTPCADAGALMTRYNINALLVTDTALEDLPLAGFITRQVIEKVNHHKLGTAPARDYMTSEFATVRPEADLQEIQEKIITHKQRILPVVSDSQIVGVITRTDLLAILVKQHREANGRGEDPLAANRRARTRQIAKFMRERIAADRIDTLKSIGQVAADMDIHAYAVGGFVRDLFLYRPNEDIDIVVEGDGIAFAKACAQRLSARIHTHAKFGTAVIIFPDGFTIDVASARIEYYRFPADLPTVEMSSIKLDMYRRDFTINTLAIALNPDRFGTLIDFFSALKDLKEKSIRVLHNLSFVEDPTRVFRAIRFEQRFGFSLGKLTANLMANAIKMDFFQRLSGRRVFTELRLILEEDNPTPAMTRLHQNGLLAVIDPSLEMTDGMVATFGAIQNVTAWYDLLFLGDSYMKWAVYMMALLGHRSPKTVNHVCSRLELPPRLAHLLNAPRQTAERALFWLEHNSPVRNSTLYHRLSGLPMESMLYIMASARRQTTQQAISTYIRRLRFVRPKIKGNDLKSLGIKPGPIYKKLLDAVRDARLNGHAKNKSDELALVKQLMAAPDNVQPPTPDLTGTETDT